MKLLLGSVCISLAIFTYYFVLLGVRNPRPPKWASDSLVSNFHSIVIIGLGLAGVLTVGSAVFSFSQEGMNFFYVLLSAVVFAGTYMGVKAMHINTRLAAYEKKRPAGEPIDVPLEKQGPINQVPVVSGECPCGKENLRKAG